MIETPLVQDVAPADKGGGDLRPESAAGVDGLPGGDGSTGASTVGASGGMDTAGTGADLPGGGSAEPQTPTYPDNCCPNCGKLWDTSNCEVLDSRPTAYGRRRRRQCECGHRFTTLEILSTATKWNRAKAPLETVRDGLKVLQGFVDGQLKRVEMLDGAEAEARR